MTERTISTRMSPDAISIERGEITSWGLRLVCEVRGERTLTTAEIADITRIPKRAAEEQLEQLEYQGLVGSKRSEDGQRWWYVRDSRPTTHPPREAGAPPQ